MKVVKLLWIDDMVEWVTSAQKNLEIIAKKYDVELIIVYQKNGEDLSIHENMMFYDFDCIIMDYKMEPFNGDKYIKDIRDNYDNAFEHLTKIPVILYSIATDTNLDELVEGFQNVFTVFRGNLEDMIKEMFFE